MIWQSIANKWNENLKLFETSDCSEISVNSYLVYNQCTEESVKTIFINCYFFIEIMLKNCLKDTLHKETRRNTYFFQWNLHNLQLFKGLLTRHYLLDPALMSTQYCYNGYIWVCGALGKSQVKHWDSRALSSQKRRQIAQSISQFIKVSKKAENSQFSFNCSAVKI